MRSSPIIVTLLATVAACKEERAAAPPADPCCPPAEVAGILPAGGSIADVADQVTPAVVSILSERPGPFGRDPFGGFPLDMPDYSLGSGVIVSSDGVIVTNSHVVAQAEHIRVALKDGQTLDAKVVGTDPDTDLAVLRVDASDLTAIRIADSSKLRTGDVVLAIGNPFGVGQTVTMGIVSAVGRSNIGITSYDDFIQTDAAINPGNSGGALVDMAGQLVGINTAIISRTGGYQGIGFAIPSRTAVLIKDSLLEHGKVIRGWLGVTVQDLTDDLARSLDVAPRTGVLVSDVAPDSPAAKAGLERGDVITAIDGVKMTTSAQLRNVVALTARGTKVNVDVLRADKPRSVEVVLGEQPSTKPQPLEDAGLFAGAAIQELDASLRARLRVPAGVQGVVVTAIAAGSPAAFMGLRPGDVIIEVNRTATPSARAFNEAVRAVKGRALVLLLREGQTLYISAATQDE